MIVITGPGRSGTSVLARLYRDLGFHPGGGWMHKVDAGFEHSEVWPLNNAMAKALGATMLHPRPDDDQVYVVPRYTGAKRIYIAARRRGSKKLDPDPPPPKNKPAVGTGRIRMINWSRLPKVVERYGDEMRRLASESPVVKDPRFSFMLPVWIAAEAPIEHVTVTMRDVNQMLKSRYAAGQSDFNEVELRNALSYGFGVLNMTLVSSDIPHTFIRFPDFLTDLDGLYDSLRFPGPVDREHFKETATKLFDPDKVHWQPGTESGEPPPRTSSDEDDSEEGGVWDDEEE